MELLAFFNGHSMKFFRTVTTLVPSPFSRKETRAQSNPVPHDLRMRETTGWESDLKQPRQSTTQKFLLDMIRMITLIIHTDFNSYRLVRRLSMCNL